MTRIVAKFGGTSLADATQFQKVLRIVHGDPRRQIIVPSAPGKRHAGDTKVTDLLYLCHQTAQVGADIAPLFGRLADRFLELERDLGVQASMAAELERFKSQIALGASQDFVASRGEYLNGLLMAACLNAVFVDPAESIVITAQGNVHPDSYPRLGARLQDTSRKYVIPGFFGADARGDIKTFSRGGSDISGAIAARAAGAEVYENWTDVSGLLMADPRIVHGAKPMAEVTYAEIRELSYMGATVLHDEAIAPVREVGIPICIRNTNHPEHSGTQIVRQLSPEIEKSTEIAGIAGKKNFSVISIEKNLMNKEVGFAYRLFGVLDRHGVSFEHCPSAIDSMSVILESSQIDGKVDAILDEIRTILKPDQLELEPQIALIAVVGEGMAKTVGIAAKVFLALRDAGVNVRLINQGASELNIIIGVLPDDYEKSVRALYAAFVDN
jgi:aspartate kinase